MNEEHITKETILNYVKDSNYYKQELAEAKKVFTPLYVDTYIKEEPLRITVQDLQKNDYHFDLYFRYNEEIPKGRIGLSERSE